MKASHESYSEISLSIIIPVYNAEATIQNTLHSLELINKQYASKVEIIIVNDGSTDNSIAIAENWNKKIFPLKILTQENMGTSQARNLALKYSHGLWIMFLDADDELAFDPLKYMKDHPFASALGFATELRKNGKTLWTHYPTKITHDNHMNILTATNPFPISSLIIKKECITNHFDTKFLWLEDWLFWMENHSIFSNMIISKEKSSIINAHINNKSANEYSHGKYRIMVAKKMIMKSHSQLNKKQTNNLLIQIAIGNIQQKTSVSIQTYFMFPCNMQLYLKLILYGTGIARRIQPFTQ